MPPAENLQSAAEARRAALSRMARETCGDQVVGRCGFQVVRNTESQIVVVTP